jgi:hypothetical protein
MFIGENMLRIGFLDFWPWVFNHKKWPGFVIFTIKKCKKLIFGSLNFNGCVFV